VTRGGIPRDPPNFDTGGGIPLDPPNSESIETGIAPRDEIRRLAGAVPDPEMPALTIADLGILRDVRVDRSGHVDVDITPTYSGCPALDTIRADVERCIRDQGYSDVTVHTVLSPAWTTEWMSEAGRVKLREYGIAPPRQRHFDVKPLKVASETGGSRGIPPRVECPRCDSSRTHELAHFGSTQCQAVRQCDACGETFPHFKEH
jgi:ring-1,2-phenylacetyl-CoA epoxidase subunit PaaD